MPRHGNCYAGAKAGKKAERKPSRRRNSAMMSQK